ncbi:MAG: ATP-binding protein [Chloroflexota bacterium]
MVKRLATLFDIPAEEYPQFMRFARGDIRSGHEGSEELFPWRKDKVPSRMYYPVPLTSFIGRDEEMKEILDLIHDPSIRIVTLIGPPGVGKTRLAVETAHRAQDTFQQGVYFISFSGQQNSAQIFSAMSRVLNISETDAIPPLDRLRMRIGEKRMLLVMDGCDQLLDTLPFILYELCEICPHLTILATSSEAIKMTGEWLYAVHPLRIPSVDSPPNLETARYYPAIRLFEDRVRAACPEFKLTNENIQDVIVLCACLEGMPFAIEHTAAKLRLYSLREVLEHINLARGDWNNNIPAYAEKLYSAITRRYERLSQDEQTVFAFLSVFSGGFRLDASEEVLKAVIPETSVSDILILLLEKSLIQRTICICGDVRFTMLEVTRHYAHQCLIRLGKENEGQNSHLVYYLQFAEKCEQALRSAVQREWVERMGVEVDNFRKAIRWGVASNQVELVIRLLCALGRASKLLGQYQGAQYWLGGADLWRASRFVVASD